MGRSGRGRRYGVCGHRQRQAAQSCPYSDNSGVLMAFRAADGQFLWQDLAARGGRGGLREFLLPSTTSAPLAVDGNHLYYVSCHLNCVRSIRKAFAMAENSGLYRNEPFQDHAAADMTWSWTCADNLVSSRTKATDGGEVLPVGDLLMVPPRRTGRTKVTPGSRRRARPGRVR